MAQPFHFTTNSAASFTEEQDGTDATWTVDTGNSIVSITGGSADTRWIRSTDVSVNSTVEIRGKSAGTAPFGCIANYQSGSQYYLAYLRSGGEFRLYYRSGGYTVVANKAYSTSNGVYYRIKLTTVTNGSNKDLTGYINGVSELSVSTSTLYGSGRAGIQPNAAPGQVDIDWFVFDTVVNPTSVAPSSGALTGGTSIAITGTDFGDGSLVTIGGNAATGISVTPNTSISCVTPAGTSGSKNVIVKFGTSGSEEYTGTLMNGYTYTNFVNKANVKIIGVRLNI